MGVDHKTEWQWGFGSEPTEQPAPGGAEYLRALKRSNQGLPRDPASPEAGNLPAGEQRRHARYKCEGSVELCSLEGTARTWASVSDLSRNGCYVEVHATYPVGTMFSLILETKGVRFRAQGVVRVSYPFLGMGIEFTEVFSADQAKLDELLLMLASGSPFLERTSQAIEIGHTRTPTVDISWVKDPLAILIALATHFRTSSTLSREEFEKMLAGQQISIE